jgi:hypothetical protein
MASERLSNEELVDLTGNAWLGTKAQTVAREVLDLRAENAELRKKVEELRKMEFLGVDFPGAGNCIPIVRIGNHQYSMYPDGKQRLDPVGKGDTYTTVAELAKLWNLEQNI